MNSLEESRKKLSANPYMSVDPAPPSEVKDTETLKSELLDEELSLFQRYRAMFSLRNRGDEKSVLALAEGKSYNRICQGSHSTWKTRKNDGTPRKPGNIMEF